MIILFMYVILNPSIMYAILISVYSICYYDIPYMPGRYKFSRYFGKCYEF